MAFYHYRTLLHRLDQNTQYLTTLPFLGQLQLERVEEVCQHSCGFRINSKEPEAKTTISPEFGYWLPHGESMRAFMNNFVGRYSKLQDSCRALEGESIWEENPMLEAACGKGFSCGIRANPVNSASLKILAKITNVAKGLDTTLVSCSSYFAPTPGITGISHTTTF